MDEKTYAHFSENLMPPGMSVRSPKKKGDSSLDDLRLTPSEIKLLRKQRRLASAQMRGKFADLF